MGAGWHNWNCWEKVGPDWTKATCETSHVYRETGFGAKRMLSHNAETPAMAMDSQIEVELRPNHFF